MQLINSYDVKLKLKNVLFAFLNMNEKINIFKVLFS